MRLRRRHPIEIRYADIREVTAKEVMAFNAVVEPMLMSERMVVIMRDKMTELRGMFHSVVTFSGN